MSWILLAVWAPLTAFPLRAQDNPTQQIPVFGTTVVIPSGLRGNIYFLHRHRDDVPDVDHMHPKGTIYTTELNVPPQDFRQGFPGITDRLEWFAIDYQGKFYVISPGLYRFRLTSDDGSYLYVDGQEIIDNGGLHVPETRQGSLCLGTGPHTIRVTYFQGPRYQVALVLEVARPGEEQFQVFSTDAFRPPPGDPKDWPRPTNGPCGVVASGQ